MSASSLSPVQDDERAKALQTLVSAFTDDPVERWLYPELDDYLAHFPDFLAAFGGRAFDCQTVWRLGEFSAVALWLPPGMNPDGEAIVSTLTKTVSPERHEAMFAVLEQMDEAHPRYPHWYLPWLGVDQAHQGTGNGSRLLRACLQIVDANQLPAYLETPNPRTVNFYRRHGFEVTGEAQAGSCPPVLFMHRAAAGS